MKKYALRYEPFGYTFFDKPQIRHQFLLKNELKKFLADKGVDKNDLEILKPKRKNYRKDILYAPIRIYYEITLGCNLHCRYCYNDSGKRRKNELTTEEIFKSCDHFKKHNVLELRFTGGELTCRHDWFEILKYAKELGFAVSCNTNAAYYNSKVCERFAELNLDQVTVSLDGGKKNHEMNRGKGTYDRTVDNIRRMHSLGVRLRINTLVNRYSVNDVEEVLKVASKYADEVNFFTIEFIGRGAHLESTDGVTVKDHHKMSQKIQKLKKNNPNLNILHFAQVSKKTSVNPQVAKKLGLKIGHPSGSTTFNVLSDGSYSRGGYIPYINRKFILGNVKTDDPFEVWQNNPFLEKMRDDGAELILFCEKCPLFISNECRGPKFETELNRYYYPEVKNPACIYGDGPSLLRLIEEGAFH